MTPSGSYPEFLTALRMRESSGDYTVVNTLGYLGAYQFGEAALVDLGFVARDSNAYDNDYGGGFTGKLGISSAAEFLASPGAQDEAVLEWMPLIWRYIEALDLDRAVGHVVDSVHLTASGLLAGAHLLGAGAVRDWVRADGELALADAYGTPLREYIGMFGGYDVPFVDSATLAGDDRLSGWDGSDIIASAGGNDLVFGRAGDDRLFGGGGDDTLRGNVGADLLKGGRGADLLIGGYGRDTLRGNAGADLLKGHKGGDHLFGGRGRDTLKGHAGRDMLEGGAGRDKLLGGRHDDILNGGRHRDRLHGQKGDDTLTGGGGPDRFVFRKGGGADTVTDFTDGVDSIRFFGLGDEADVMKHAFQTGSDVVFDFDSGDSLTVLDTMLFALADDIIA